MSEFPPATHANDPPTSAAAERRVTDSGTRARHASIVLRLVRAYPGRTAVELHRLQDGDGLERHEISRRLSDLEKAGSVRKGVERPCSVNGTQMVTWLATDGNAQRLLF